MYTCEIIFFFIRKKQRDLKNENENVAFAAFLILYVYT